MLTEDSLKWLEDFNLIDTSKENSRYFERVLKQCLGARDEKVLVIGDEGWDGRRISPMVAGAYYAACKNIGLRSEIVLQEPKQRGEIAEDDIVDSIDNLEEGNILVLSLSTRLGSMKKLGASYRNLCRDRSYRFVSLTSVGKISNDLLGDVLKAVDVDYKKMRDSCKKVKELLDDGNEMHVTTDRGTDFYYNIKGKKAISNDGDYTLAGTGGNIPAGEVYIAPRAKMGIYGKIVIDGSIATRTGTVLVKDPITLEIEQDKVLNIEGGVEARKLSDTLDWAEERAKFPWGIRRVGELGVGMNENAKLIGATIIDEKVKGTAHIALGSNYWFGGTIFAIVHLDQVFRNPTIFIDNKKLEI
ncbi:aminopeptidase [Candidatus Woesearchaeota archaeon]|nr:aminopeptidase [Candidatus Woesearchaeota archaeon]